MAVFVSAVSAWLVRTLLAPGAFDPVTSLYWAGDCFGLLLIHPG
jgi:hypothetical protein